MVYYLGCQDESDYGVEVDLSDWYVYVAVGMCEVVC